MSLLIRGCTTVRSVIIIIIIIIIRIIIINRWELKLVELAMKWSALWPGLTK